MEYAVRKRILHLCNYITDKTAVVHHVSREFNMPLTIKDIEWVLSRKGKERPLHADRVPLTPSPLIVTHTYKGHDPLAKALFEYHAKRTTGAQRQYWLARLNDKTPRPVTTIQL